MNKADIYLLFHLYLYYFYYYYYCFVCMDGEYRVALSTFWGQNGNMGCIWCVRHFNDRICNCTFIVMRIFIYLKNLNAENKEYFLVTKCCLVSVGFTRIYNSQAAGWTCHIELESNKSHTWLCFFLFFFLSNKTEPSKVNLLLNRNSF